MRGFWSRVVAAGAFALVMIAGTSACSSTASFDSALAKGVEAKLGTAGKVSCEHRVRELWLCSYEPDPGSNSYAEVIVRRGAGACWAARRGHVRQGPPRPYSPRSYSFGRHEAVGPTFGGCA
ncbi:MAG TPA: hypothetical protein VMF55_10715 [Solirubrobacterales bacterium]|nr:hypothetical protein [Solirubrobacterales bacterium]